MQSSGDAASRAGSVHERQQSPTFLRFGRDGTDDTGGEPSSYTEVTTVNENPGYGSEQTVELGSGPETPRRRRGPAILIAALLILLAAAAAYWFAVRMKPWDPAACIPRDVAMAMTVDLTASKDRTAALEYIEGIFKDAGVEDPRGKLFERISTELGIDFEKDVLAHINGRGGMAVLSEMAGFSPTMVVVIGARSGAGADSMLKTVGDTLNRKKMSFARLEYKKCYYYRVAGDENSYVGAVDRALVVSNSEDGFKKVVDTVQGGPNLLGDENFSRARQSDESTFATMFASGPGYYKMIAPQLSMASGMLGPGAEDSLKGWMENAVAAVGNAKATGEGVSFNMTGIMKEAGPQSDTVSIDSLASRAARDASFAVTSAGWDKGWREVKDKLLGSPGLKEQVDEMLAQARMFLQLDPFADLLDLIKGVSVYYEAGEPVGGSGMPGTVVATLEVSDAARMRDSLSKLRSVLALTGQMSLQQAEIGGETVFVSPDDGSGFRFCQSMVGDNVVLVFTGSDLRASFVKAAGVSTGASATLSDAPEFATLKKHLPAKTGALVYGNVSTIMKAFEGLAEDDEDRKVMRAVADNLGAFAFSSHVEGANYEIRGAMPFKKARK